MQTPTWRRGYANVDTVTHVGYVTNNCILSSGRGVTWATRP